MSEKLTPHEWVASDRPEAKEWRQALIQRWEQGGAKVFQRVFRQAQAQAPGALFRQPAQPIERPSTGAYFDLPEQPAPTGNYFNVPGAVGHRTPPAVTKPATRRRVAEMISGRFQEIVGDGPIVWEGE